MPPEVSILKLLPEGVSVTAVMLTFILGIKYVKFLHTSHKSDKQILIDSHEKQVRVLLENHKEERDRFKEVLIEANETNKELITSHKMLMEEHLRTSGEMVTAVRGLEAAVRDLQSKVK